ncbi:hypothetical protein PspS35_14125 [Pseudomonas sp. S35]|nr:hypothetical protein PspS35_14125 [Pseudomonas sp. S35]
MNLSNQQRLAWQFQPIFAVKHPTLLRSAPGARSLKLPSHLGSNKKLTRLLVAVAVVPAVVFVVPVDACSGLMKPDTHLGENARQIEVSDDQTTSFLFR